MKKFFEDFKKFITRGNVLDMAVGVIVGGAFSTIVNTLNKNILMPVVNWALSHIPGMSSGLYTILPNSILAEAGTTDAVTLGPDGLSYTVLNYIDWSSLVEAILNFFFIALTLFIIVRVFTYLGEKRRKLEELAKKEFEEEQVAPEPTPEPEPEPEPAPDPMIVLLTEIRDSLKAKE